LRRPSSSFHPGTAAGPTGLRPEHLKVVLNTGLPSTKAKAADGLRDLVNAIAGGRVLDEIALFISSAILKKGGGVRPIAVGLVVRRLVAKCFNAATAVRAAKLL
jgi:hypothetical protein